MAPVMRDEREHEPFAEWSALAAVGALDGAERARFDAHLVGGCAACETNLLEGTRVVAALAWTLPDAPLRAEVRDRLMARVAAEARPGTSLGLAPTMSRRSRGATERRPWRWAGGLVAAGLATVLVWGLHDTRQALESARGRVGLLERELEQERAITSLVAHTDTHVAALRGLDAAARADGWIVWSPSKREGFMVVHHLPMLPPGQRYHLWTVGDSAWAPAGTFEVDHIGHAALTVRVERERPERFAVTVELESPRTAPRGPTVMQGAPSG
jgi:Anti-sigma-K factor rskA, C-terminal